MAENERQDMRPAFIGFALVWIVGMCVTNFRLMVNAPEIFIIFLIPPVILLIYGLRANEPLPEKATDNGDKTS
jgi:hypothetical protein